MRNGIQFQFDNTSLAYHDSIKDVQIEHLMAKNAYTFVRLLSAGNPIENIVVDGIVGGFRTNGINIDRWRFPAGTGVLRNITIRNCRLHKKGNGPQPFIQLNSKVDGLRIKNFQRELGGNPKAPTILIDNHKTNQIEMRGLHQNQLQQLRKNLPKAGVAVSLENPASLESPVTKSRHQDKGFRVKIQVKTDHRVVIGQGSVVELKLDTVSH